MKRILPYILSCILLVYLIIVLTFVATKSGEVTCRGVRVAVNHTDVNVFVDEEDVMKAIKKGYGDIMDKSILAVNKDSLERVLVKNPMIKSAQVYYSLDGYIHVNIQQREPILRVLTGEGYYVDRDGRVMPLSSKFTSRVVVATGDINKKFASLISPTIYPCSRYGYIRCSKYHFYFYKVDITHIHKFSTFFMI